MSFNRLVLFQILQIDFRINADLPQQIIEIRFHNVPAELDCGKSVIHIERQNILVQEICDMVELECHLGIWIVEKYKLVVLF